MLIIRIIIILIMIIGYMDLVVACHINSHQPTFPFSILAKMDSSFIIPLVFLSSNL